MSTISCGTELTPTINSSARWGTDTPTIWSSTRRARRSHSPIKRTNRLPRPRCRSCTLSIKYLPDHLKKRVFDDDLLSQTLKPHADIHFGPPAMLLDLQWILTLLQHPSRRPWRACSQGRARQLLSDCWGDLSKSSAFLLPFAARSAGPRVHERLSLSSCSPYLIQGKAVTLRQFRQGKEAWAQMAWPKWLPVSTHATSSPRQTAGRTWLRIVFMCLCFCQFFIRTLEVEWKKWFVDLTLLTPGNFALTSFSENSVPSNRITASFGHHRYTHQQIKDVYACALLQDVIPGSAPHVNKESKQFQGVDVAWRSPAVTSALATSPRRLPDRSTLLEHIACAKSNTSSSRVSAWQHAEPVLRLVAWSTRRQEICDDRDYFCLHIPTLQSHRGMNIKGTFLSSTWRSHHTKDVRPGA